MARVGGPMQPADLAAAAVRTAEIVAIHDQASSEGRGDQQVEETAVLMPGAELHLSDRRRRGVVLDVYGHSEDIADQLVDLDERPRRVIARLLRQVRAGDIVRECNSDAYQALAGHARLLQELPDRALEECAHRVRLCEGDLTRRACAHLADEIQHDERDVVAVDVEADGKAAIRVDDELGGRLAPWAA